MNDRESSKSASELFSTLHERAKELNCLYNVEEILSNFHLSLEEVFRRAIKVIPPGWQYPEYCQVQILYGSEVYASPDVRVPVEAHPGRTLLRQARVCRLGFYVTYAEE